MRTSRRDSFEDDEPDDRPAWREPGEVEDRSPPISDRDDPLPGDVDDTLDDAPAYDTCPYCGKVIHEDADVCAHCHSFVHFDDLSSRRPLWILTGTGLALLGVLTAAGLCAALWFLK